MEFARSRKNFDTIFLMTVGVLLAWSIVAAFLNVTTFSQGHFIGLIRLFILVGFFRVILSNKYRLLAFAGVVILALIFIIIGFATYPPLSAQTGYPYDYYYQYEYYISVHAPNIANRAAGFIRRTMRYIDGSGGFSTGYSQAVVWSINFAVALFVTIFSYFYYKFFILFGVTSVAFIFLIASRFFSLSAAFYVYIFAIMAYLVRHLNINCRSKAENKASFLSFVVYITIFCIAVAVIIPRPGVRVAQTLTRAPFVRPVHALNDAIYFSFGPRYFSLRQVGFGGTEGGLLGGDLIATNRLVMMIRADRREMPMYLTGAILGSYTGRAWLPFNLSREYADFGRTMQNIEFYEQVTSSLTSWMFNNFTDFGDRLYVPSIAGHAYVLVPERSGLTIMRLIEELNDETVTFRQLETRDFVIGVRPNSPDEVLEIVRTRGLGDPALRETIRRWMEFETEYFYIDISPETFAPRTLDVNTLNHRTFSVFRTGITRGVHSANQNIGFLRDSAGQIVTRDRMPRNTWYTVMYNTFDDFINVPEYGEEPDFPWSGYNLLEHSRRGILREISDVLAAERSVMDAVSTVVMIRHNDTYVTYEDLLNYYLIPRAEWIHAAYTLLPRNFPSRVQQLALSITAGAANDYQRARMLESHLRDNFTYTLTPGNLPEGRDFVDHFLFDLQMGYCTYFATAFVTMARSLGLPARYVEGFMVSGIPNEHGLFNVLSSMGHAWGEVYFEGFGWVRFEPTPADGLPQPYIPPWMGIGPYDPYFSDLDWLADWELELLEQMDMLQGGAGADRTPAGQQAADVREPRITYQQVGLILIAAIVLAIAAVISIKVLRTHKQQFRAKSKEGNEAVLHYFGVLLRYMRFFDLYIEPGETAEQFAQRVDENFDFDDKTMSFAGIAEIFNKARYSTHETTAEEREIMELAVNEIDVRVRVFIGKGKYLYYKYIAAAL